MNQHSQRAKATFYTFFDALTQAGDAGIQQYLSVLHPEIRVIGSTKGERFLGIEVLKETIKEVFRVIPGGVRYQVKWWDFMPVSDTVGIISAELYLEALTFKGRIVYDLLRVTMTTACQGDQCLIHQIHTSKPEVGAEEGEWFVGAKEPKVLEEVSVLFSDFEGFTQMAAEMQPRFMVAELNDIFTEFDLIMRRHGLTKIKTIGDAYMAASGIEKPRTDHAHISVLAAKEMLGYLQKRNMTSKYTWNIRIGIHSGPLVCGVIGTDNLSLDLWGDTVNIASRIEGKSLPGKLNITRATLERLPENAGFGIIPRGMIPIKNKGPVEMFFIE